MSETGAQATARPTPPPFSAPPLDAVLALEDGTLLRGSGFGTPGTVVGEVCFNTAMSGYQEILTDPSYAGQLITFTFPHIGNVGTNDADLERETAAARGLIVREPVTPPANWRATEPFTDWVRNQGLVGISGVDTRALTTLIRDKGPQKAVIAYGDAALGDVAALLDQARRWPGLEGMDLAKEVTTREPFTWDATRWQRAGGAGRQSAPTGHVVAIDYGAKHAILRCLAEAGARVTVVPATASFEDIMALEPDGIFLSNGPGDPAATGAYALPVIRQLLETGLPIFGICLGHQLLALALGGRTFKMQRGHRGANHPVQDTRTGKVEITSMNHGFCVAADSLPDGVAVSHISLFDGTVCGLEITGRPVFSVQQHPEASPGPQDSFPLFSRFMEAVVARREG
ncbi:glutamine-hydrolyzing carbamoyl-phosphate synthase small subunit [Yunchengibacter salinarum]|uniref:glutamine-hydrolyzing carbamoyl-phosphate synthase small subunit n=1 Tax=Yunchengibacter salinarum TaxID=3133399 RepID=UPI0035B5F9F7